MHIRQHGILIVLVALSILAGGPRIVLAQGRGHHFGMEGGSGHQHHTGQGMEPQMQQISGLMGQMAERIKAGPLAPEQALHLSGMLEQLGTIMNKMAAGMADTEVSTHLETMKAELAAMQLPPPAQAGFGTNAEGLQRLRQP